MNLFRILFFMIFSIPLILSASKIDTNYIYIFNTNTTLRIGGFNRNIKFSVRNKLHNNISYSPNLNYCFGGGISYRGVVLQGFLPIPNTHKDESIYGKTKYIDLQINMFARQFGGNVFYRNFDGLNQIYSDKLIDINENRIPQILRDDIKMKILGGEGYYVFNDMKFSMPAACKYTERQKESAGSFLLLYDVTLLNIDADSSIIPINQKIYYSNINWMESGDFISSNLLVGYTYSFVIKKQFFFTPFIFAGPGYCKTDVVVDGHHSVNTNFMYRGNLRIRTGYNGNKIFGGLIIDANVNNMPQKDINYQTSIFTIQAVAGYRLNVLKNLFRN